MSTSLGHELSQQPVQLRAQGRGSEGPEQGERQVNEAPAQLAEYEQGRWISPVKILHGNDCRRRKAEPLHQRQHCFQDSEPKRWRLGKRRHGAHRWVPVADEQAADLRSFRIRGRGVKVKGLHQRPERPVSLQLRRRPDEGLEPMGSGSVQDFGHKPGLPDPSLTFDEGDLARAFGGPAEQLVQGDQLRGTADKGRASRERGHHPSGSYAGVPLGRQSRRARCFTAASPRCGGLLSQSSGGCTGMAATHHRTC
jgi:hypothetical protein